jgi:hypothetical protein
LLLIVLTLINEMAGISTKFNFLEDTGNMKLSITSTKTQQ